MKKTIFSSIGILIVSLSSFVAAADVYVGVEKNGGTESRISLSDFSAYTGEKSEKQTAADFRDAVRLDLMNSRRFYIFEDSGTAAGADMTAESLNTWKKSAPYLVTGSMRLTGEKWVFSGRIYKFGEDNNIKYFEKKLSGDMKTLQKGAHIFSDYVIEKITGSRGISNTKIAFINDGTGHKEVYVADYDGSNVKRITSDNSIDLLPKWSRKSNKLYYTTYRWGNPDMVEIDFSAGQIKPFSSYQGLNVAGDFSPDGSSMTVTLSHGGDPSVYTVGLNGKKHSKLISNYGITTSPSWSPDGNEIVFVSDVSGNPQIHVKNLATGKTRRVTNMNWCDSPAWSPSGQWIVFSGRETSKEKFNIFITDTTGSQIIRLTSGAGNNENPVWSPDGRFLAFTSSRNGGKEIFVMDADGSAQHRLVNIKGDSYTPSWSGF